MIAVKSEWYGFQIVSLTAAKYNVSERVYDAGRVVYSCGVASGTYGA